MIACRCQRCGKRFRNISRQQDLDTATSCHCEYAARDCNGCAASNTVVSDCSATASSAAEHQSHTNLLVSISPQLLQLALCRVQIAAVFEFAGALLLGRVSTNVIAGGIADINAFLGSPEAYAYGMVCALGVGTLWLILTSWMGLNVSSTHSIGEVMFYCFFVMFSSSVRTQHILISISHLYTWR